MMPLIQNFDNSILVFIKNNMHSYIMDKAMVFITSLGSGGTIWIILAVLLILNKKYRNIGIMVLGALAISSLLGDEILKNLIRRVRPSAAIPAARLLVAKPASYSFPSGHSAASFAAAGVLAVYFRKYAVEIYCLAALIAFSRLYLYVHYPTDVIAGTILGLICSKITIYLFNKIYKGLNEKTYQKG